MNEKKYQDYVEDKSRSYELACKYLPSASQASQACELALDMDELLTTVRQEVRAGAFRDMMLLIQSLRTQGSMNYRRGYEEGVRDALRTLEAAANSVPKDSEGEGVEENGRWA